HFAQVAAGPGEDGDRDHVSSKRARDIEGAARNDRTVLDFPCQLKPFPDLTGCGDRGRLRAQPGPGREFSIDSPQGTMVGWRTLSLCFSAPSVARRFSRGVRP